MSTPPWGQEPGPEPGQQPPPPPNPYGQPASPYQSYGQPYGQQPSGQPYGAPSPYGGFPITKPTNGMAVASMVVSIVGAIGLCCYGGGFIIGVVGAILGHVAKKQIRQQDQAGDGMALAGIIVGWITFAIGLIVVAAFIIFVVAAGSTDYCHTDSDGYYVCD